MLKKYLFSILFHPDPADGTGAGTDAGTSSAGAPPAAEIVANAEVTEDTLQLKKELEEERKARRKAETDAAHAQDEARRLKEAGLKPVPPATPVVDKRSALEKFMETGEVD